MRVLEKVQDPIYTNDPPFNSLDRFFLKLIADKRDLPFVYLCLKITFISIPWALILYTSLFAGSTWWIAAILYMVVTLGVFMGPFILMLHNTSHRRFFKREYDLGNYYIPWILGFFFGQSPETYLSHHIGMHHAENNQIEDRSCTMYYQRDSFLHFLQYFGLFFFVGVFHLVDYFKKKNKRKFLKKVIRGEFTFLLLCILLSLFNFKATLVVFILPFVISRFFMMAGNWAQHAFVKAGDPENNFCNSITCINTDYNQKCFNDGYHIGHHLRPHMHWTEMPRFFLKNLDRYADNEAIVFHGLDYNMVWFLLMTKRYDVLASRMVNVKNKWESDEQVISMLKSRTRQFDYPDGKVA